jgi:hypothetical protein
MLTLKGYIRAKLGEILMLPLGGLHVKHAVQHGNFGPNSAFALGQRKTAQKPRSSWPVAGPSGCKLTSSQQSGIKDANPNISPYLCCALFVIQKHIFVFMDLSYYAYILDDHKFIRVN